MDNKPDNHNDTLSVYVDPSIIICFYVQLVNIAGTSAVAGMLGIGTNIINMIVFIRIGFTDTVNISLFAMAVADLAVCAFVSAMAVFTNPLFQKLDLPLVPTQIGYLYLSIPRFVFAKVTTILTAFVSFERCLSLAMPLKVKTIVSPGRVKIVMVLIWVLVLGASALFYYYQRIVWVFYPSLNKSLLTLVYTEDREKIEDVYSPVYNSVFSMIPFILIIIFTLILVIVLKRKTAWRKTATTVSAASNDTKERRITKTVIMISSLFIVCYLPNMCAVMLSDPEFSVTGSKAHIYIAFGSMALVIETFNSAINIFIYYYNSSIYKSMFDKTFLQKLRRINTK